MLICNCEVPSKLSHNKLLNSLHASFQYIVNKYIKDEYIELLLLETYFGVHYLHNLKTFTLKSLLDFRDFFHLLHENFAKVFRYFISFSARPELFDSSAKICDIF